MPVKNVPLFQVTSLMPGLLSAPAQGRRLDRRVPIAGKLIVQAQERNRTTSHLQGGDIVANQRACDGDIATAQDFCQLVSDNVEFEQRGAAHAVDKRQDILTSLEVKVFDDGSGQ